MRDSVDIYVINTTAFNSFITSGVNIDLPHNRRATFSRKKKKKKLHLVFYKEYLPQFTHTYTGHTSYISLVYGKVSYGSRCMRYTYTYIYIYRRVTTIR